MYISRAEQERKQSACTAVYSTPLFRDKRQVSDDPGLEKSTRWTFRLSAVLQGLVVRKLVVYYESMKREVKTRPIYECRCDERLKTKVEESTCLGYTGLLGELEHLKTETRLIDEMFASVMGEYVFLVIGPPFQQSLLKKKSSRPQNKIKLRFS